jgi:hypothetical protein
MGGRFDILPIFFFSGINTTQLWWTKLVGLTSALGVAAASNSTAKRAQYNVQCIEYYLEWQSERSSKSPIYRILTLYT